MEASRDAVFHTTQNDQHPAQHHYNLTHCGCDAMYTDFYPGQQKSKTTTGTVKLTLLRGSMILSLGAHVRKVDANVWIDIPAHSCVSMRFLETSTLLELNMRTLETTADIHSR